MAKLRERKCLIINDKIDEFMKTLEEVKAHVNVVGYNQLAIHKIEGFLLGNGLLCGDFEMEYTIGESDFDDFRKWFNEETKNEIDWNEFGYGDFIHVEKDLNVIALGDIYDGKFFVGTTGNVTHLFELTTESRPCDENEIEIVENKLKENGVVFCCDKGEFVPFGKCEQCELEKTNAYWKEKLNEDLKELRRIAESMSNDSPFKEFAMSITENLEELVKGNTKEEIDSAYIDKLEMDSKDALENIIANLHGGELSNEETKSVIDALNVLVELGKMYE